MFGSKYANYKQNINTLAKAYKVIAMQYKAIHAINNMFKGFKGFNVLNVYLIDFLKV